MWSRSGLIAFAMLFALSGCSGSTPGLPVETALPSLSAPTATQPEPAATSMPTATLTATDEPTVTFTPEPVFKMCSPLADHPLDELPEIIGDPYNPPPPGREERHHGVDFGYYHWRERGTMLGEAVQSALPGGVASVLDDHYPY